MMIAGSPHRLRVPDVPAPGEQAEPGPDLRDHQGRRQHRVRVPHRGSSLPPYRYVN